MSGGVRRPTEALYIYYRIEQTQVEAFRKILPAYRLALNQAFEPLNSQNRSLSIALYERQEAGKPYHTFMEVYEGFYMKHTEFDWNAVKDLSEQVMNTQYQLHFPDLPKLSEQRDFQRHCEIFTSLDV